MLTTEKKAITVETTIKAPVEKVWSMWTDPKHIINWNNASEDWYTPHVENDVRTGGKFNYRMESRDGQHGFDIYGEYNNVTLMKQIKYTMDDGRIVQVTFNGEGDTTYVNETFEAESENSLEIQQEGWQAILDNFKRYVEKSNHSERLHFEILINASVEKVYSLITNENYYREWTSAFNPSSTYKGSWQKGSKIIFLGEDKDGVTGGMVSRIRENIPNRFISIEHQGIYKDGKEILCGPEADMWSGSLENYVFEDRGGQTLFSVDADAAYDFKQYFMDTWPIALEKIKSLCETESVRGNEFNI